MQAARNAVHAWKYMYEARRSTVAHAQRVLTDYEAAEHEDPQQSSRQYRLV